MSEYWKSTPKYWCKHCGIYVRDTKLERTNHEATGKHQGAIKRSLRDLHRNAEQQERDKERARREVERLNGVVSSVSGSSSATGKLGSRPAGGAYGASAAQGQVTETERQKQLEQLAELGVNIPTELRGNMAMAGEWTVTNTRVVAKEVDKEGMVDEARATGVKRERERTEEEKEQEEAIKGLFTKRRKWGVDSKRVVENDEELDKLLSGSLVKGKKAEAELKKEESQAKTIIKEESPEEGVKRASEQSNEPVPAIKKEPSEGDTGFIGEIDTKDDQPDGTVVNEEELAAVVFKKRKPKNIRQK